MRVERSVNYRIAGKFGGDNVWRIYSYKLVGEKSLANGLIKPKNNYCVTCRFILCATIK